MSPRLYIPTVILVALVTYQTIYGFTPNQASDNLAQAIESLPATQAYVLPASEATYLPILDSTAGQPALSARSALIYDPSSGRVLFSKNSDTPVAIASLTKLMTAAIVREKLNLDDVTTIGLGSLKVDEEKQDLYLGEVISVRNLLTMMLIQSSNDAAYALADHAKTRNIDLLAEMNQKAYDLGMSDTHFLDPAGLNDEARSSAEDLVKLVRYLGRYPDLWALTREPSAFVSSTDQSINHSVRTTNQLLAIIPGIVGGKTGYTDGALGCMALVVKLPGYDQPITSIVLGSTDRFGETQRLIAWVTRAYRWE